MVRALLAAKRGGIVNIASMAVHGGGPRVTPYSASKAALANLTRNVAAAHAADGIRCNAILPGWMDTRGEDLIQRRFHAADDGWRERAAGALPMGRLVDPDHVAFLATYLLGGMSGVMTGALVDFDQNVPGTWA
jgi:NAD(P)-dependent dehydrogenase (short-subunit alcohol dehydrogenase family)